MEFDATFIIATISFVLFVIIMNKIFYSPILKIMQDRQNFVENNFNSAKNLNEETIKQTNYHNSELDKTRTEARLKVNQASHKLKKERSEAVYAYKEELYSEVFTAKETLRNSAITAKEALKDNVVDIAKEISLKLLGNDINSNLIDKSQITEE